MKSIGFAAAALLAFLQALALVPASAQAEARGLHTFGAIALAPAGDRLADIEGMDLFFAARTPPRAPVVVRSVRTGEVVASFDPCQGCRYIDPAWSPGGDALAFVAYDAARGRATLELAQGGEVHALAAVDGVAQKPRFSPDGRTIALLATPGAHKQTGAVQAGAEQVGDIGALAVADEQRIGVVALAGGGVRYVSPADTFVYEYDWRPDGQGFVATAAKGNGDDNWWIAKLVAVDLSGGEARVIAAPRMQMDFPRVSPDGTTVAVIGGLMSDFGATGGDVYTVPLAGGELKDVTPGVQASFTSLERWRGEGLDATLLRGADAEVVLLDPRTGAATTRWRGAATIAAGGAGDGLQAEPKASFSLNGAVVAMSVEDFTHPQEIYAGAPGAAFGPLTRSNAGLPASVTATSFTWDSDGRMVQGWLVAPRDLPPGRRPMVVEVHGGPSSVSTPKYVAPYASGVFATVDWLKQGYLIFYPNPRGSFGQGEAFTRANVRDFGGGDLRDILAGVDAVEASAPVDDARLGVVGHSYGGFMVMWAVTHSRRFKAAVSGAGIADWISYYGENGIDQWLSPFFGPSVYDDPAIYEKLSPIFSMRRAATPTLLYVGERDVECPPPQSFEFWHGLKAMGVPTSLVVYARQGHAIRDPADLADLRGRELAWFDKYLGA